MLEGRYLKTNYLNCFIYYEQLIFVEGPSWSWSYGSWVYNYICIQCLSPLTLWVRILLKRGVLDTTLCDKVCLTNGRSVVFSCYSGFLHQ